VPEVLELMQNLAREVVAVAEAQGYQLDAEQAIQDLRSALVKAGPAKASMRQDVEAGRRTEIDVITGAVLRAAEEHGVSTPLNRAINALIRGYEATISASR